MTLIIFTEKILLEENQAFSTLDGHVRLDVPMFLQKANDSFSADFCLSTISKNCFYFPLVIDGNVATVELSNF